MTLPTSSARRAAVGLGTLGFCLFGITSGTMAQMCPPGVTASVCQPSGEIMPQPTGPAEIGVVASRGFPIIDPTSAITLTGLFYFRGEALDPVLDAHITPGTFSPMCGFTGQLVLRGGGCNLVFGWYNVTPGSTTPPPDTQIYQLVPADPRAPPPQGLMCMDGDFCPLATTSATQATQHTWIPTTFSAANIRSDPNYKGGLIGFAIVGDARTSCAQTKYSQAELNTKQVGTAKPWITTLIWQSKVNPDAYYIGFEDLPLTPATWKGQGGQYVNDGDFNDFVYYITGLTCEGGGKRCDTGSPGVCAGGTTQCTNGTMIVCKPDLAPSAEICDGLDNDCDGMIDQGNPCPNANQICDRGVCVNQCNDTEFPCAGGFQCDQGYCKDPACIGRSCPVGQICVAGQCQGGCDGAVCPPGQICRIGRCVDPCAGIVCPDAVCENGACVPLCSCRNCGAGLACAGNGHCVDSGCEKMTCGAGTVCAGGGCIDPCSGTTKCPAGQACSMGLCNDVPRMIMNGRMGVLIDAGAAGGNSGTNGAGSGAGARDGSAAGSPSGTGTATGNGVAKCGCDLGGTPAGALSLVSLMLACAIAGSRRRRS
jgi:hypothetical protein